MRFLTRVLVNAVGILLVTRLYPGALGIKDVGTAAWAALVLAAVNATLRPVLLLLALPFNLLTLGLATLGVNTLLLWLVVGILGIPHGGILALGVVSLLLSMLTVLLSAVLGP